MKGLPPPPPGVMEMRLVFDVDGVEATVGQWIAVPGLELASTAEIQTVIDGLLPYLTPFTTGVTHAGCSLARVDCRRWGPLPLRMDFVPAENQGYWTGGQLAVGAGVLHWLSGRGGKGFDSLSFMPGFPDLFTDDHARLNAAGWSNYLSKARDWLAGIAATPGVSGGHCVHGTVHRKHAGAPLDVATFTPTIDVTPSPLVGTLDRRRRVAR